MTAHLSTRVPHDLGDPVLNTWILWWNARALPLSAQWWSPPILVPMRGALALSEHLAGLSLFAAPIQLLGGRPLLAYNVCLVSSYALSGWFAYLLVWRLTASRIAALVAGLAFVAAPYRAGQLAHLQVLTSQWIPAMLLGMHGYVQDGRRRWLALLAAGWLLQGLSNGYYLLFLPVLIAPWLVWFVDWRAAPRRGIVVAATWLVASLPFVPICSRTHPSTARSDWCALLERPHASARPPPHSCTRRRCWRCGRPPACLRRRTTCSPVSRPSR